MNDNNLDTDGPLSPDSTIISVGGHPPAPDSTIASEAEKISINDEISKGDGNISVDQVSQKESVSKIEKAKSRKSTDSGGENKKTKVSPEPDPDDHRTQSARMRDVENGRENGDDDGNLSEPRNDAFFNSVDPRKEIEPEEELSTRDKVYNTVEGKTFQILMALITIFALWGDDFRLYGFYRNADNVFYILYLMTFLAFVLELMITCIVVEGYKWSFFFGLDVIATVSILLDVEWILTGVVVMHGGTSGNFDGAWARTGRATRAGTRTGRVVRIVRLMRLVRFARFRRCCGKEQKSELDKQAEIEAANNKNNKKEKRVEASRLGKMLSEQTTRTVIIGVLCMMVLLPVIEDVPLNIAAGFALENLFWFGLSACTTKAKFTEAAIANKPLECSHGGMDSDHAWISEEGYDFMKYEFTQYSRYSESGIRKNTLLRPMLSLKIPDIRNPAIGVDGKTKIFGAMRWVEEINTRRCVSTDLDENTIYPFSYLEGSLPKYKCPEGMCCWKKHDACWNCPSCPDCAWRSVEIRKVVFTPDVCTRGRSCENFRVVAYYLDRYESEVTAGYQLLQTTFIVVLLGAGAMIFSKDTQVLVITPIEKMVDIVKQLADDPLTKPDVADEDEVESPKKKKKGNSGGQLETSMLENTILKIGGLLQVGFGEAGAQIIGKNMSSQDGELNILIPGRKVVGIFGFCDIREFTETTECLLEEVMVFVNKIARIVHICVHEWSGAANKNIGDSFLVTWIISDQEEQRRMLSLGFDQSEKLSESADKSLIAFLKVIAELRRASDLSAYARHPKIIPKFGMEYHVSMGFGLHVGWAIEGAIGSEHKIDASYLSPHVNMSARLETATRQYGIELLFSEAIHKILSTKAKERCRKLDVIMVKGSQQPMGIFTFDVNEEIPATPDGHVVGQVIPPAEITAESLKAKGIDWTFVLDQDIIRLQEGISLEFHNTWRQAFHFYINGKWPSAKELFVKCSNQLQYGDGPSECLHAYITSMNCQAPEGWAGCRTLDSK